MKKNLSLSSKNLAILHICLATILAYSSIFVSFLSENTNQLTFQYSGILFFSLSLIFLYGLISLFVILLIKYESLLFYLLGAESILFLLLWYFNLLFSVVFETMLWNFDPIFSVVFEIILRKYFLVFLIVIVLLLSILFKFAVFRRFYFTISVVMLISSLSVFTYSFLSDSTSIDGINQWNKKPNVVNYNIDDKKSNSVKSKKPRNIYYIIADSLGSEKSVLMGTNQLKAINMLNKTLENGGFSILSNSFSGYNTTYLALHSLLEMDYPITTKSEVYVNRIHFFPGLLRKELPRSTLENRLYSLGYGSIYWFGNKLANCDYFPNRLECPRILPKRQTSYLETLLLEADQDKTLAVYIETAIYSNVMGFLRNHMQVENTNAIIQLKNFLLQEGNKQKKPSFYFIHQMMPHPPYVTPDCKMSSVSGDRSWHKRYTEAYNDSVLCLNSQLKSLLEIIEEKDRNSVIVIQGDHGAFFLGAKANVNDMRFSNILKMDPKPIFERFAIYNALKLPNECQKYFSDDLGAVNTMRLAVACASGILPKYVEEKSFFVTNEGHLDFGTAIDVTSLIRKAGTSSHSATSF